MVKCFICCLVHFRVDKSIVLMVLLSHSQLSHVGAPDAEYVLSSYSLWHLIGVDLEYTTLTSQLLDFVPQLLDRL